MDERKKALLMILSCKFEKTYEDFLCSVDFKMGNEVLVIQGPSGSGKTTILKAIGGFITPESGRIQLLDKILFDGEKGIHVNIKDRQISTVFQSYDLFPHLSLYDNAFFNVEKTEENLEKFDHLVEILHLREVLSQYPSETSGGQQQRGALLRAFMHSPKLLLLDEPFSALDEELKGHLISELKTIREETKLPMILITHQREEALKLGDRILTLENGKIIKEDKNR